MGKGEPAGSELVGIRGKTAAFDGAYNCLAGGYLLVGSAHFSTNYPPAGLFTTELLRVLGKLGILSVCERQNRDGVRRVVLSTSVTYLLEGGYEGNS